MSLKGQFLQTVNRVLRPLDIEIVRRSDLWRPTDHLGPQPRRDPLILDTEAPFLKVFQGRAVDLCESFDFAVIVPTTLRPTVHRALKSIFRQQFDGRVQVLIGVDVPLGSRAALEETCRAVPERHCVFCVYPGYSIPRCRPGC